MALAGCRAKEPQARDAGAVPAADAAVAEPVDAGLLPPSVLPLAVTASAADGGLEQIDREVEPVKHLSVRLEAALTDYRIRVFDETDRVVPSDDVARDADGGIDYAIDFVEPLKTGRTYRLTVESQAGSALDGYLDGELVFKVRGQLEPERRPAGKRKRKR